MGYLFEELIMKYEIRILKGEDFFLWDKLVDESKFGTIFNKSVWTKTIQNNTPGIHNEIIGIFDQKDLLLGGINVCYVKVFKTISFLIIPPGTPHNGFIFSERDTKYRSKIESQTHKLSIQLVQFLEKRYQSISIALNTGHIDIRPFIWMKYNVSVLYTTKSNIPDFENSFEKIDYSIKKQIKKSRKIDYQLRKGISNKDIDVFLELEKKSFQRQGHRPSYHKTNAINFLRDISIIANPVIYTIYIDDKPVASRIEIIDNEMVYDWRAGADPKYFHTGANQLLLWLILEDLNKEGLKKFDFGGVNTSTIASYKAKFNFDLVPYYHITKVTTKRLKLLLRLKDVFTRTGL